MLSPQLQMYLLSPGASVTFTGPVVTGAAGGARFSLEWHGQSVPSPEHVNFLGAAAAMTTAAARRCTLTKARPASERSASGRCCFETKETTASITNEPAGLSASSGTKLL